MAEYSVIDSFIEIENLSKQNPVLLITDKADSWGTVCWSRIEPFYERHSELTKYLKKNPLDFCGCFLFKNGVLLKYEKVGGLSAALSKDYINGVSRILINYEEALELEERKIERAKIRREEERRRSEYERKISELKAKYEQYKREGYAPDKDLEGMLK